MRDVMKRLELIENSKYFFSDMPETDLYKDMEFLISTIKQLHAENERYKKALELMYEDITRKALATDETDYDESAKAYELDGEFK